MSVPVAEVATYGDVARSIIDTVAQVVHDRDETIELAVAAAVAGGHVLIEDVPGSGKTTLARALAAALGGDFRRIQGTADMMPADITGSSIWEPGRGAFSFVPGPVFANLVLLDELNRTPPRTQSALLEAMDEGFVTVDGIRHRLPDPFVLLATQNPYEQWGTYPLPEGLLDRFAVLLPLGENTAATERRVVREQLAGPTVDDLAASVSLDEVRRLREQVQRVHVADSLLGYAVDLCAATRRHASVGLGASTRSTIALMRCAQALALLRGRPHVLPDDVKQLSVPVLAHRLSLRPDAGAIADDIVRQVVADTPAPLHGA
jgi:MoxR-like ATPase